MGAGQPPPGQRRVAAIAGFVDRADGVTWHRVAASANEQFRGRARASQTVASRVGIPRQFLFGPDRYESGLDPSAHAIARRPQALEVDVRALESGVERRLHCVQAHALVGPILFESCEMCQRFLAPGRSGINRSIEGPAALGLFGQVNRLKCQRAVKDCFRQLSLEAACSLRGGERLGDEFGSPAAFRHLQVAGGQIAQPEWIRRWCGDRCLQELHASIELTGEQIRGAHRCPIRVGSRRGSFLLNSSDGYAHIRRRRRQAHSRRRPIGDGDRAILKSSRQSGLERPIGPGCVHKPRDFGALPQLPLIQPSARPMMPGRHTRSADRDRHDRDGHDTSAAHRPSVARRSR